MCCLLTAICFNVTASSSTSVTVTWDLPPADSINGTVTSFHLLYKKKGYAGLTSTLIINNGTIRTQDVTGLDKYTEYEFQVLAFTNVGSRLNSSVKFERTLEDGEEGKWS